MSESAVIIISSDEDSNPVKVSKENEVTSSTNAAQTSNEKFQNNEVDEVCVVNEGKSSVDKTPKETGKKCIKQSEHFSPVTTRTETDSQIIENNLIGNESLTFKKLMNIVVLREPDEENKTKLIRKLSKYHKSADPYYVKSSEFSELLEKGIEKINKNPVYLYFVLKEVKDALISNKVGFSFKNNTTAKATSSAQNPPEETPGGSNSVNEDEANGSEDEKKYEIVKKLTSLLKKLEKKIKELEEMEVDFSDEEDSSYFRMQRYRERYCQVYKKLCTYTNHPLDANRVGASRKINFYGTDNLELNRAIEKWLNKIKQFPDYSDVNKLMNELNQTLDMKLSKEQIRIKAQQVFEKIGNMLQRRRHFDLWESLSSFLDTDIDPAMKNPELDSELQKNFDLGVKKERELISYYVELQEKEKIQPREVPDEEANCSPVESGDEDEKEIEIIENMLDSKISSDEDEDEMSERRENEEKSDGETKSHDGTACRSGSKTTEDGTSRMHVSAGLELESRGYQRDSASNGEFECKASQVRVHSKKTEIIQVESEKIPAKDENAVDVAPSKQYAEDNPVFRKCRPLTKIKSETTNDEESKTSNENVAAHSLKRFSENDEGRGDEKNFKKTKLTKECDSDSDCEIVEIVQEKRVENTKDPRSRRKVYQVNYAFIHNNFNYNTVLTNDIFRRRRYFCSKYKSVRNQPSHTLSLADLRNIKSITNKFERYKENNLKRKLKHVLCKQKSIGLTKGCNIKFNSFGISLGKNSISCATQQETNSDNTKGQKETDKVNENNNVEQGSGDTVARAPNGGSSGGGNGQDNSENNGNKKPFDQGEVTEDKEAEENEEKEENEEENGDGSDGKQPETSEVVDAPPQLVTPESVTYQNDQNNSVAAQLSPFTFEKTVPFLKKNARKQLQKTYSGEYVSKERQTFNFIPAAGAPKPRTDAIRRKKLNQNGGIRSTSQQGTPRQGTSQHSVSRQGMPRQGIFNAPSVNVKKVAAAVATTATPTANATAAAAVTSPHPTKHEVNKVVPSAAQATDDGDDDDDIKIIEVTKKKHNAPVKAPQSDEEIVQNFLQRSHPSISITTPKKRIVQREPPPSVLQAMETLSRLKGISTTIVKSSSKYNTDEDITVISESLNTRVNQISKLQRTSRSSTATATATAPGPGAAMAAAMGMSPGGGPLLPPGHVLPPGSILPPGPVLPPGPIMPPGPVLPSGPVLPPVPVLAPAPTGVPGTAGVPPMAMAAPMAMAMTSMALDPSIPKIVTVQGNVAGFDNMANDNTMIDQDYCPLCVQNPQGHLSNASGMMYEENYTGTMEDVQMPRFRNVRSRSRRTPKTKTKNVEYITLD